MINRPAIPDLASVSRMILTDSALLVRKTPSDVASAGHDRCIINLRPEHVEAWLTPEKHDRSELQAILSDRAVSTFEHAALKVA